MVFLGSSGSEAMEAAIKVAERAAGPKRPKIVYAQNSFHGKTKGVLSLTDSELYRGEFQLTGQQTVKVPFGDIEAIRKAFESDPEFGVIVLETIQGGGGIIEAPIEFWQQAARALRQARRVVDCRRSPVRHGPFGPISSHSRRRAYVPPDVKPRLAKSARRRQDPRWLR